MVQSIVLSTTLYTRTSRTNLRLRSVNNAERPAQPLYDASSVVKKRQQHATAHRPSGWGIRSSPGVSAPEESKKSTAAVLTFETSPHAHPSPASGEPYTPTSQMQAGVKPSVASPISPGLLSHTAFSVSPYSSGPVTAYGSPSPSPAETAIGPLDGVAGDGEKCCVICWNADRETILAPCGHYAMCR